MKRHTLTTLLAISCLFSGCASDKPPLPSFSFSNQEIIKAKAEFKKSKYEILFFLMVDQSGKVVRSKVVDWKKNKILRANTEKLKQHTYKIEFRPATTNEPEYREFIYPMEVNTKFEWI